jgi:cysteine-rich repeat protein
LQLQRRFGCASRFLPRAALGLGLVLGAVVLAAGAGRAHQQSTPIGADGIVLDTSVPASALFAFDASGEPGIVVSHNPLVSLTALLVRGEGAYAGRTPLIRLDPSAWGQTPGGYLYSDPGSARGGITGVLLEAGELRIDGGGAGWPWSPAGPQDSVWLYFRIEDEWYCAEFPAAAASVNEAGRFEAGAVAAPGGCPEQVCGNGEVELGEACDDGNLVEDDGCTSACAVGECTAQTFESTYDAIQQVIFDEPSYGCTNAVLGCHGVAASHPTNLSRLDLRAGSSYAELLGPDGEGAPSTFSAMPRVVPLNPQGSFLYRKLAAKLDPDLPHVPLEPPSASGPGEGDPMPRFPFPPLLPEHLEALQLWIQKGAPREAAVERTAPLLGTCLPEPLPIKIPVPDPPPVDPETGDLTGVQLQQTPWPLPGQASSQGEDEICMATFYDVSALVPDWAHIPCPPGLEPRKGCSQSPATSCSTDAECGEGNTCRYVRNATNPGNECFAWHRQFLRQDPQSHHSIIQLYAGGSDQTDPAWGAWSRKSDDPADPCYPPSWPDRNQPPEACLCDPAAVDPARGANPGCSGGITTAVACIGYGPADATGFNPTGGGDNLPQFSGSQQAYYDYELADGAYATLPVRGVVVWNSHAFNRTQTDSTMAQYLNLHFAEPPDQLYPTRGIFDARWIFAQNVPAFGTQELCGTFTLPRFSRLFQLSSHTHERGVRWRTWLPREDRPIEACRPACTGHPLTRFFGCDDPTVCSAGPNAGMPCETDEFCGGADLCSGKLPLCSGPLDDKPVYLSSDYSDPLNLDFDPPLEFDSADPTQRTLLYCSLWDNGATPSSPPVKRRSTSPLPPPIDIGFPIDLEPVLGGPCPESKVVCLDGPNKGALCGQQADPDAFCGVSEACPDCVCDACPAHGGVTTKDEMFIALGGFFVVPEPPDLLLGLAALGAVGWLTRRRG